MPARYLPIVMLLLAFTSVYAEEADAPLELIELLGEMEEEDALEIAMSDIHAKMNEQGAHPLEVKDDE